MDLQQREEGAQALPSVTSGFRTCKDCPSLTVTPRAERCEPCQARRYREKERTRAFDRRHERAAQLGIVIKRYNMRGTALDATDDGRDISETEIEARFAAAKARLRWERVMAMSLREVMA